MPKWCTNLWAGTSEDDLSFTRSLIRILRNYTSHNNQVDSQQRKRSTKYHAVEISDREFATQTAVKTRRTRTRCREQTRQTMATLRKRSVKYRWGHSSPKNEPQFSSSRALDPKLNPLPFNLIEKCHQLLTDIEVWLSKNE